MIQVCACIVFTYRCHYMSIFMFYIGSFQVFKEFVSCMCPFWANRTRGLIDLPFWFSLFCLGEIAMNYMCSLTLSLMSITIVWNFHRQAVKFITIHQNQPIVCLLCFRVYFFARKHWNWRNVHSVPCFTNSGFIFVVCSHSFLEGIDDHLSTFISGMRSCDPLVWFQVVPRAKSIVRSCSSNPAGHASKLVVISFNRRHYSNISTCRNYICTSIFQRVLFEP